THNRPRLKSCGNRRLIAKGQKIIDEVILTVMRAPKSYTKEDIVEINCHGGIVAQRAVLDLALENGARLAEPGEFTKRAFLNGRIDLTQAEAVLDIIRAKTDSALRIGAEQLRGGLSAKINTLRKELLEILAVLEAKIDFPDEETGEIDLKEVKEKLCSIDNRLKVILKTAGQGRVLREGIQAVICGKPNVGKSSLLNALLKQERSIVTPVAGTTRDTIEEIIDIKGIPIRIVDTAGIIEPRDLIEKEAVLRSKRCMESADLVILLFDASQRLTKEDEMLIRRLKHKTALAVINKIDLKSNIEKVKIIERFKCVVDISAKKGKNIAGLEEAIANLVYDGRVLNSEPILVSNLRHIEAMRSSQKLVAESLSSLDNELSIEFIAQGLKDAVSHLDNILGKNLSQDLLSRIFSKFCIGK
ncbi:MAG TPA: tRNA uridine-5-carboxymethylaminomethyl(34) synthesis GTPase MnmE, partial [Candidatus Omnitrophota bacterium]|nr:tRNA uridine-5-carboxymethylaminomethyl(34) synthesis GTPase MnmE [Candidatus Omnitrophota bacterium]